MPTGPESPWHRRTHSLRQKAFHLGVAARGGRGQPSRAPSRPASPGLWHPHWERRQAGEGGVHLAGPRRIDGVSSHQAGGLFRNGERAHWGEGGRAEHGNRGERASLWRRGVEVRVLLPVGLSGPWRGVSLSRWRGPGGKRLSPGIGEKDVGWGLRVPHVFSPFSSV